MIYGIAALFVLAVLLAKTYRLVNESIDGSAKRPLPVAVPRASNGVAVPVAHQPDPSTDAALMYLLLDSNAPATPEPVVTYELAPSFEHTSSPSFETHTSHDHGSSSFDHGSSFDGGSSSGGWGD
jgi:uncharacterized membrane protein YgcG